MSNHYPLAVEKIVNDYVERLKIRFKGMNEKDQQEALNEIQSHIYESYVNEPGDDEIDRILTILKKLGEPADVISSWMPETMLKMAKKKKSLLYILAGILIAFFGVPLGIGALGIMGGILAGLLGILIGYFAAAISMVVAGFFGALVCFITIVSPDFVLTVNHWVGHDVIQFGPFQHNPALGGGVGLVISILIAFLGLLMLWSGKHIWRGLRFVLNLMAAKIKKIFTRSNGRSSLTYRV